MVRRLAVSHSMVVSGREWVITMRYERLMVGVFALTVLFGMVSPVQAIAPLFTVHGHVSIGDNVSVTIFNLNNTDSLRTTTASGGWYSFNLANMPSPTYAGDSLQITAGALTANVLRGSTSPQRVDLNGITIAANDSTTVEGEGVDMTICVNDSVTDEPVTIEHTDTRPTDTEASGIYGSDVGYVRINVSDDIASKLSYVWVNLTYTLADLDKNGDGDATDVGDIQESTLQIYWYNNATSAWEKLQTGHSKVNGVAPVRVDATLTTAGRIAANVSSLSTFGLTGTVIAGDDGDSSDTHRSSGGGGSGTYPPGWLGTPTATVTSTQSSSSTTPDTTATTARTAKQAATKKPTVKQTTAAQASGSGATADAPAKKGLPGFEGVFAIAGLLAIAYVMMRQKR